MQHHTLAGIKGLLELMGPPSTPDGEAAPVVRLEVPVCDMSSRDLAQNVLKIRKKNTHGLV